MALLLKYIMSLQFAEQQTELFRASLLQWYDPNQRPLPWKGESNPYFIWLSEIILQQTRVEQGLSYYLKFIKAYPTVKALATAPEDEVFKNWEGLGYYSRARNLLAAARYIHHDLGGQFPETYEGIIALKGVGPYTAAAISSFAFHLPYAVLDGNVYRVLARYFGIHVPIDSTPGKKQFQELAQICLDHENPSTYNQAIMDFGATLCKPKKPLCESCPLKDGCRALTAQQVQQLPIKTKKIKKRNRYFYFLEIHQGGQVLLQKRTAKDIWQDLHQFPLIETDQHLADTKALFDSSAWQHLFQENDWAIQQISKTYQQTLTHQKIFATFLKIEIPDQVELQLQDAFWQAEEQLKVFAFPKIIDWYLADNSLYLSLT